jgi:DNA-binding GntR family transcriptional regulator
LRVRTPDTTDHAAGEPVARQLSEVDRAQQYIAAQISLGVLRPGDKLVESQLARALEMSRTPVREALARLEVEGVVESRHKQGAEVARITRAELVDIYDIRMELEGFGARLAASAITLDEIAEAEQILAATDEMLADETLSTPERAARMASLNADFHLLIATASRNHLLPSMIRLTLRTYLLFTLFRAYTIAELRHSNEQHRAILRALAEHDSVAAERLMRDHARTGLNVMLREVLRS